MHIGLASSFLDPALAVLDPSGKILFAEATERPLQEKRALSVAPDRLSIIERVLHDVGEVHDGQISVSASWSGPFGVRDVASLARGHHTTRGSLRWQVGIHNRAVRSAGTTLTRFLSSDGAFAHRPVVLRAYDHHLTHAATAAFTSPYERASCAVVDGLGERTSTSFFGYEAPGRLTRVGSRPSLNSLGLFYSMLCEWCGFSSLKGEEWKVMGLAAYGEVRPNLLQKLRQLIAVDGLSLTYRVRRNEYRRIVEELYTQRRLPDQDPLTFADLARTGQEVFTDCMFALLRNLHAVAPSINLVAGGGCFLNSALNGQILDATPFENLHVFAAPGDDGNALGAALLSVVEDGSSLEGQIRPVSPFLGSIPDRRHLLRVRESGGLDHQLELVDLPRQVAGLLADGQIVGWMRGPAEFGPRALGARSVLADPRSKALANKINTSVKFRETFRPFAPAILPGFEAEYFQSPQPSVYMDRALQFTEAGQNVPGVRHVDGSGRLQTVSRTWNPVFHDTIQSFYQLTGVPMLLNTSLNVMGKPIVHTVEDAVAVFLSSAMDAIVIEDTLFSKGPRAIQLAVRASGGP